VGVTKGCLPNAEVRELLGEGVLDNAPRGNNTQFRHRNLKLGRADCGKCRRELMEKFVPMEGK
jgi:hypothetical protein